MDTFISTCISRCDAITINLSWDVVILHWKIKDPGTTFGWYDSAIDHAVQAFTYFCFSLAQTYKNSNADPCWWCIRWAQRGTWPPWDWLPPKPPPASPSPLAANTAADIYRRCPLRACRSLPPTFATDITTAACRWSPLATATPPAGGRHAPPASGSTCHSCRPM